jgi:hypothetical protein
MKTTSLNHINNKLKDIPDNFFKDIVAYLDFISSKANSNDWAIGLSEKDLKLIAKGTEDIKNGRTLSHSSATKKIAAHIKSKK